MRRRRVIAVTVVLVALGAAPSFGAGASLTIHGPARVRAGTRANVTVSGQTSSGGLLAVYAARGACARRLEDELHRNAKQVLLHSVNHGFSARVKLPAARRGTHHVCGYLYHRKYDNLITDARASLKYVAR